MSMKTIAVLLLLCANVQMEIDPVTGRPRIKRGTCLPDVSGPPPKPLPDWNTLYLPGGEVKKSAVYKARTAIDNARGWVWQQPDRLPIQTRTGTVTLDYFDAWAKTTEWGKHGPRLEAWGQAQAIARGATPAEFAAALATWKQGRQAAAQAEIQRIEQRFLDQHGVSLADAERELNKQ